MAAPTPNLSASWLTQQILTSSPEPRPQQPTCSACLRPYAPTTLLDLSELASRLGVNQLLAKDEGQRMLRRTKGSARMDPITLALAGLLAYRTYQGQGKLAEWIGHQGPNAGTRPTAGSPGHQLPPLLQSLGAAPLAQGLSDLLKDFQQKGFGETIRSWVEKGPNNAVSTTQLEQALGEEKIAWLVKQTGMPRDALLEGLSRELPTAIDQLTPDGRLPTEQEIQRIEAPPVSRHVKTA